MSLARFSVRQVVLVNLLFVLVLLAGVLVSRRIPLEFYPDVSLNTAIIVTVWPGASPDEIERLVTTRLEDEIDGVPGIKEMVSFSDQGVSEIQVDWKESLDALAYESSLNELRAALDRVTDLPAEAEEPLLRELTVSEVFNVCMVAITDEGGVGERVLREAARDLIDRLERLPGVDKVIDRGLRDRELHVYVDRYRALQYDLTLGDVSRLISSNNTNIPGGTFTDASDQEISIRGIGNFATPELLAETIVRKNPDGTHVKLGELADVTPSFERPFLLARYQGKPAVVLGVAKHAEADILAVVEDVQALVAEKSAFLPPGTDAAITWDNSRFVRTRIAIMQSNLLVGVIAVAFVLWLTVGIRNAMLAIVAIPFSFLAALIVFQYVGITINTLSLVGFIMVSGMLVDHAIIIVENIYRRIEEGEEPLEAIVRGTEQVMWPVIATVATTLAAFIPMLMVSGTSGEFMAILPKATIIVLSVSLVEALIVLPAHYLDWGSRSPKTEKKSRPRQATERAMARAREVYLRLQEPVLAHRYAFAGACTAALFFSFGLAAHVPLDLFPSDFDNFYVSIDGPVDYGIGQTDSAMQGVEEAIAELDPDLLDYATYVGLGMSVEGRPLYTLNRGVLYVTMKNTRENREDPFRVLNGARERVEALRARRPGVYREVTINPPREGPPIGKPVAVRIQSSDYDTAKAIAAEIKAELARIPGTYNVRDNMPVGPRELRVVLDEHRASLYGLTFADVGMALRAANDGLVPTTFKDPRDDEDIDIRVLLPPGQRQSIADLLETELRSPSGELVQIGDVARVDLVRGYQRLYHFAGDRTVVVYADVDTEVTSSLLVNQGLEASFADVPARYPGTQLTFGGEFEQTRETFEDMGRTLFLALIAIFAILAAQFRSYVQPLIVMSVIAFAFIGVVAGMWLTGHALSMYVIYAIVGLAGIVVNDSLVLIDFVNKERERGTGPLAAVRLASRQRFRPIVLTTVTTTAGLAPMALGIGGTSTVFGPFATAIVFGLLVASSLTLFLVPALYLIVEDAVARVSSSPGGSVVQPETPSIPHAAAR